MYYSVIQNTCMSLLLMLLYKNKLYKKYFSKLVAYFKTVVYVCRRKV